MALKKEKRYVTISNDDGAIALAAAIIKQARHDYIRAERTKPIEKFVKSDWFGTLSMESVDRKTVLDDWGRARYVYSFFEKVRLYNVGKENYKKDTRYFRNLVGSRDVTLLEYLIYFNDKYDLQLINDTIDMDLLARYGWARQNNSIDICETFRSTIGNNQTRKYNPDRVYGYKYGQWVTYNGEYYKCHDNDVLGEFDPTKWTKHTKEEREAEYKYYVGCKDPGYLKISAHTEPLEEVDW